MGFIERIKVALYGGEMKVTAVVHRAARYDAGGNLRPCEHCGVVGEHDEPQGVIAKGRVKMTGDVAAGPIELKPTKGA